HHTPTTPHPTPPPPPPHEKKLFFPGADPASTTLRGFDIVPTLSTLHQWFPYGPLSVSHLIWFFPDLFLPRSRPWLLTIAAGGGLEPAPASRFRGAVPHQSSSYTHWALLGPLRSWRTIVGVPDQNPERRASCRPDPVQLVQIDVGQQR